MNKPEVLNNKDLALLLLRLGVGVIFAVSGWGKLTGIEGVQGFFGNIGIPLPDLMAWVVAIVEFVGGLMIIAGYRVTIPGLLLAFIMLVAIWKVKLGGDNVFRGMRLELMLLLTSLALSILSTGRYSLDAVLDKSPTGGTTPDSHS